jgi:hypothetical protein
VRTASRPSCDRGEFGARIKAEAPYWAKIIKEAGVQAIE